MDIKQTVILLYVVLASSAAALSQTTNPPVFLTTTYDTGGAIGLRWESQSNLVYRIEYADALSNQVAWQPLYEDFPSQGTNTIWKDAGADLGLPPVPHPNDKDKRFYRVVLTGTNTSVQPQIAIVAPTNGSVLTDYVSVSVSVSSALAVSSIRLFVDGQEAGNQPYPATNFAINTAQFPNGPHKLFAVVETFDGSESTLEATDLINNFTASPYCSVTFDNYITDFRGSALFLETADSETIKFKANFADYSDWTLTISNLSAVTVRTVTNTGYNMTFVWDGKNNSGNVVSPNFYSATLSAVESSSSPAAPGSEPDSPPSPGGSQNMSVSGSGTGAKTWYPQTRAEAIAIGSDVYYAAAPPLPPVKKDGKWYSWEDIFGPQPPMAIRILKKSKTPSGNSFASAGGSANAAAAAGAGETTLIPPRAVGAMGTVGVAYQGHHPKTSFGSNNRPSNGLGGRVTLNNNSGVTGAFGPLKAPRRIRGDFHIDFSLAGYRTTFYAVNDDLVANDLRGPQYGGTNKFNKVNIGLLIGHGVYGSTPDFTTSGSGPFETYFPIYKSGVNSYDWVRFTQFDFGSSGSDLRWMAILSCNNMIDNSYDDMWDKELLPIGDDLHLLLGSSSVIFVASNFGRQYASALTGLHGITRRTVAESWFYTGTVSQGFQTNSVKKTVSFRVAGWPACFSDDLVNYSAPDSGNPADITSDNRQVYP